MLYKRFFIDRSCSLKMAGSCLCLFYGMATSFEQASTKYSMECDLDVAALFTCVTSRAGANFFAIFVTD